MKRQIIPHEELEEYFDEEVRKDVIKMICGTLVIIFQIAIFILGTIALMDWIFG